MTSSNDAEQRFTEWFLDNYGPGCVLSSPAWHAPKIWRAAKRELLSTTPASASSERAVAELAARFERYAEAAQRGAVGDDPKWAQGRAAAYRRCAKDVLELATLPVAVSETGRGETAKKELSHQDDLYYEIEGVLHDTKDGEPMDEVCRETLRRVQRKLFALCRDGGSAKMVPLDPTPEMVLAASSLHRRWEEGATFPAGYWQAIYRAMLAASPSSQEEK